jgi:polyhydroxybutyrate depolymerase
MKLFRVACSVAVLGSALAFAGSAQAQQLVCQTTPANSGAGMLRAGDFGNCRVTIGGVQRTFDIHVPAAYTTMTAARFPLVVDLHGFNNNKQTQANGSGFRQLSDLRNFIYVTAQGLGNSWNAMGTCCGNQTSTDNEIRFITRIVTDISRNGRIDATRVFANGFSNGASMANTLACGPSANNTADIPRGVFKGIGTVSFPLAGMGGMAGIIQACRQPLTNPLRVIAFHGTNDGVINFNGGAAGGLIRDNLSAANSNRAWAQIQGCAATPTARTVNNTVSCSTFSGCRGANAVSLCTVRGGAHVSGVQRAANGTTLSATEIYNFWTAATPR